MRGVMLLAAAALAIAGAAPPPEAERAVPGDRAGWATDGAGGCWVHVGGVGAAATDLSAVWDGGCPDGPAEGRGRSVMRWRVNGEERSMTFEGILRRGKAEGQGRLTHRQGAEVVALEEGEYRDDYLVQGRLVLPRAGLVYEGGFQRGQPHGEGRLTTPDRTYAGEWTLGCLAVEGRWIAFTRPPRSCEGQPT